MNQYPQTKPVCQLDAHGYYLGQTVADLDPMAADGSYLLPAGCVDTAAPQQQPGKAAWWDAAAQAWQYRPDYRGRTVYNTADGSRTVIDRPGELPDGLTALPRPSAYHIWSDGMWQLPPEAAAQMLADAKNGKLAGLNHTAQSYINQAAGIDKLPDFEVATWTLQAVEAKAWAADKSAATPMLDRIAASRGMDADTLKAAALRKALAYERLTAHIAGQRQALQTKIEAAQSQAALDEIVIGFAPLPEAG